MKDGETGAVVWGSEEWIRDHTLLEHMHPHQLQVWTEAQQGMAKWSADCVEFSVQ